MDSGFGSGGTPFEYAVAEAKTGRLLLRKLILITLYIVFAAVLLIVGVATRLLAPFLALVPLSLWILIFFTWRLTQVEYEYSFFAGRLTVSKIFGNRTRKKLCEVQIRDIDIIVPAGTPRADGLCKDVTVFAASGKDSPDLYYAMWKGENQEETVLAFDMNEKALKILRYYNMAAMTK